MKILKRAAIGAIALIAIVIFTSPSVGQDAFFVPNLSHRGRIGNLVYESVRLDGRDLFVVAATRSSTDEFDRWGTGLLQVRIARIENRLNRLLQSQLDPDSWTIAVGKLNGKPVVQAVLADSTEPITIVTITNYDAEIHGLPEAELAEHYAQQIELGLSRSYRERQPDRVRQHLVTAVGIAIAAIFPGALLILAYRQNRQRQRQLRQQLIGITSELAAIDPLADSEETDRGEALRQTQYQLKRQLRNLKTRLRSFIFAQAALWLTAMSLCLRLFPQTRSIGMLLLRKPFWIVLTWLLSTLAIYISHQITSHLLQLWVDSAITVSPQAQERRQKRRPTLSHILKNLETVFWTAIGAIVTVRTIKVFSGFELFAGAGVIGLAASIAFQSALNDAVSGIMLLWHDAFTVGDLVAVGEERGAVENLGLLVVQLRSAGGEFITLRNGNLPVVENMTKEWARIDLSVDVAYDTDTDRAMAVMAEVLADLIQDEEWGDRILEGPEVLAVENLAHSGVTLIIRAKTVAQQQWGVSREYRRRLKRRFAETGIEIGRPQQVITIKSGADKQGTENL